MTIPISISIPKPYYEYVLILYSNVYADISTLKKLKKSKRSFIIYKWDPNQDSFKLPNIPRWMTMHDHYHVLG